MAAVMYLTIGSDSEHRQRDVLQRTLDIHRNDRCQPTSTSILRPFTTCVTLHEQFSGAAFPQINHLWDMQYPVPYLQLHTRRNTKPTLLDEEQ